MGRQGGRGARGAAVFAVLAALAAVAAPARADVTCTTTVTDLGDSGVGTLRDALTNAADGDTICLPAGTITLSSELPLDTPRSLVVAGDSAAPSVISGEGVTRVLHVTAGSLELDRLTVSGGNAATDGDNNGGGVLVDGGALVANQSAFLDNTASGSGGAIAVQTGSAELTNSTVSGNHAADPLQGGAIAATAGTVTLASDTVAFNTGAPAAAGGLAGPIGSVTDSVVALNRPRDCAAAVSSGNHDLDTDGSCFAGLSGALQSADPLLAPAADNGGPTLSIALRDGSPAIDAGASCPAVDQTGLARTGTCDLGAYEWTPPIVPTPVGATTTTTTAAITGVANLTHAGTYHVDYGLTDAYGAQTAPQPIAESSVSATIEGLTPGTTYHYRLVVDGSDGEAHGADATFTTATPPPVPPQVVTQIESQTVTVTVPVKPAIIEAVLLPPVLSNLRVSPTAVIPMEFGGSVARAHGARVTYTGMNSVLSKFTVDRVVRGLRHGATCARRPARSKGPSCDRFVRLRGTFTHQDVQGPNAFRFTGGLNGSRLKPGRYRLNATPRDLTGRLGSTISATFRVVRR